MMPFAFWKSAASAFDPTDSATAFCLEGDYAEAAGAGTWTATVGANVSAAANAPAETAESSPDFGGFGVSDMLINSEAYADWFGDGEHTVAAVIEGGDITSEAGVTSCPALFSDSTSYTAGLEFFRTGAGPYQYFARYFEFSGSQKEAVVEITALVDANGAGRLILIAKKEGGTLYIKAGAGSFTAGDACGDSEPGGGTLRIGGNAADILLGTVRAIGFYDSAKDATWASSFVTWAAMAVPP